jgi:hypothetical protein
MNKKIIVTGATGLIGRNLVPKLISRGDSVAIFTRNPEKAMNIFPNASEFIKWDENVFDEKKSISNHYSRHFEGKDAVIHLAGTNIFAKRWGEEYKKEIVKSRINSSKILVDAISETKLKPGIVISASAIGYYGNTGNSEITEQSKNGNDFLASVCYKWEDEISKVQDLSIRWVGIRIGIVLSKNGGALSKMILPYKFFVGGSLGNGMRYFSWIHIDDLANLFLFALDNNELSGVINGTSPNPVRIKDFSKILGQILNRPSFFNVPSLVLKILLGESSEALLISQKVIPKKLLEAGFKFKYDLLEKALENLLRPKSNTNI